METKGFEKKALKQLKISCSNAITRVKGQKDSYKGVKSTWSSGKEMYADLVKNKTFLRDWMEQYEIYLLNGKQLRDMPSIDRIESRNGENRHYTMDNIRVLSHGENSSLGGKNGTKKCQCFYFRNSRLYDFKTFKSVKEVFTSLGMDGYNVIANFKDRGKLFKLENDDTVLIQTLDGDLKKENLVQYRARFAKGYILEDYKTGEEKFLGYYHVSEWLVEGIKVDLIA